MEYGGRSVDYWSRMLTWPRPSIQLTALRALSRLGPQGAEVLARRAPSTPETAWALARSGHAEFCPLARIMAGGRPRPQPLRRLRQSRSLLTAFYWAARLDERDTSALIDLLRHTSLPVLLHAAAWALGQIGRPVLAECLDACRQAAAPTRRRFCRVFWYLGPAARGAENVLASWLPDPYAEGALLALEEAGSLATVGAFHKDRTFYPVWLDECAVEALAALAFGQECRIQAVRALGGFGPDVDAAGRLLGVLADDPDRGVRLAALEALVANSQPQAVLGLLRVDPSNDVLRELPQPAWETLLYGADPDGQLHALWRCQPKNVPERHWDRLEELRRSGPPGVRHAAIRLLVQIPAARGPWLTELLSDPSPEIRCLALSGVWDSSMLRLALNDPSPEVQRQAARSLLRMDLDAVLLHHSRFVREVGNEAPEAEARARALLVAGHANPTLVELAQADPPLLGACLRRCQPCEREFLARKLASRFDLAVPLGLLDSERPAVRRAGAATLRWMIPLHRIGFSPGLEERLARESSWSVRVLLAEALGLVAQCTQNSELRVRLARHENVRVASRAVSSLPTTEAHVAFELLEHPAHPVCLGALRAVRNSPLFRELARFREHSLDDFRKDAYLALIAREDPLFLEGWKDACADIRALVLSAAHREALLPTNMLESIARGHHHTPEALEFLELERRFQVLARSLAYLDQPARLEMARRLGRKEQLDAVLEHARELLPEAVTASSQAMEWLAGRWTAHRESLRTVAIICLERFPQDALLMHLKLLTELTGDPDLELSRLALDRLARGLAGASLEPAVESASCHPHPRMRMAAARAALRLPAASADLLLSRSGDDPDEEVAASALRFSRLADHKRVALLAATLDSPDPLERAAVADQIVTTPDDWLLPLLIVGLQDEDPRVRNSFGGAVLALQLLLPEAVPVFFEFGYPAAPASRHYPPDLVRACLSSPLASVRCRAAQLRRWHDAGEQP